jgi:hypothetical protein
VKYTVIYPSTKPQKRIATKYMVYGGNPMENIIYTIGNGIMFKIDL